MDTNKEIRRIQKIFKRPSFINKYLNIKEIERLKHISYYCGMDYASNHFYDFKYYVSRYDHSLNTALVTYQLTHDKEKTLAALLHDIASPCFSHVIDYMNEDYVTQESTEEMTRDIIRECDELIASFKLDNISVDKIFEYLENSIVNNKRPKLCADRIDGIIIPGLTWLQIINADEAIKLYKSIDTCINEDGEEEICINNEASIKSLIAINDAVNSETQKDYDIYLMNLLAMIVKTLLEDEVIKYNDLYILKEYELIMKIEQHCRKKPDFNALWHEFRYTNSINNPYHIEVKQRSINPLLKLDFKEIKRYNKLGD
ncbi:MAG: HD domain-containing protein [Bacilli bacterium]|nr:HD domain-containing protein [Bacilli bacterium]